MDFDVKVHISVHEIICWIGLFMLAWNPNHMFADLIESLGMKVPFFMLASGAGSPFAKRVLDQYNGRFKSGSQ